MTTITIEQSLLEQALNALLLPCDRWNKQQFLIVKGAIESLNAALAAPATAPEKTVKEIMEFVRHYAANTFSSATLEDKIRRSLAAPATAPDRSPMHEGEIQAAWLGQDLDEPMPYTFVLGIRSAERFNGIKETP